MNVKFVPKSFNYRNPNLLHYAIESNISKLSGRLNVCFEDNGNELYLDYIEISDNCRNCGIGTEILMRLIKFGKNFGSKRIYLLVDFDNEGAQRLYTNLGFVMTGNITPALCYEMEYIL